jgi:hypothetical protein
MINPSYCLTTPTFDILHKNGLSQLAEVLLPLSDVVFINAQSFIDAIQKICPFQRIEPYTDLLLRYGSCGRRAFEQYFGWLNEFTDELYEWRIMLNVLECAKHEVKCNGLDHMTPENFRKKIFPKAKTVSKALIIASELHAFLTQQAAKIPVGVTCLGTSDIIESVFGKYKGFSARCALKDIGKMILLMPVFTTTLTAGLIKNAMEKYRVQDIRIWLNETLGTSLFSKRKLAFGSWSEKQEKKIQNILPKVVQI